ncbi:hypothetical protein C8R44DRAFT_864745 [Mycena epipterygia]|nr:hypothetical protein C8R44DRAFT_864745 [Mycena epipterygia]
MKSASRSTARPTKFSPYMALPLRPSVMTARNGPRLRVARLALNAPIDTWLAANSLRDSTSPSEVSLGPDDALCTVYMTIVKGTEDGIFKDADVYCLSLAAETRANGGSPLMRLARYVGSCDDGDAPLWTRMLQPHQSYDFVQPKSFMAALACGMTDIRVGSISTGDIPSRMLIWASALSADSSIAAPWPSLSIPVTSASSPGLHIMMKEDEGMMPRRTRLIRRASPVKPRKLGDAGAPRPRSLNLIRRVTTAPSKRQREEDVVEAVEAPKRRKLMQITGTRSTNGKENIPP